MGRNHFSKAGGPYFINDGFSSHSENQEQQDADQYKYILSAIGFVSLLAVIGMVVVL
jgi:hypothetical protein